MLNYDPRTITIVEDPGHGWAIIPASEIERVGAAGKISPYSYANPRAGTVALEEDGDLGRYVDALCACDNIEPEAIQFVEHHTDEDSPIRALPSFRDAYERALATDKASEGRAA